MLSAMRLWRAIAIGSALVAASAFAADGAALRPAPRVNYEYRLIPQQPVAIGKRIEVVEFFWYGCPYCYGLQPALENWLKRKPADVELRRIPAVFRESWIPHARLYYTLEALGEIDRLHQSVYNALHLDRENLSSAETSADWAARHGVDRERFTSRYNSPEIDQRVRQSISDTRAYAVQGTPSLVVDGRFITSTGMTETIEGVFPIVDDLIRMAREQRASR